MGRLATHHTFAFQRTQTIFSDALSVFLLDRFSDFAGLQSRVHEMWGKFLGLSFKDDPRYIPEDCFETFPFADSNSSCEDAGRVYYGHRSPLMLRRTEGMTSVYNRFHDRSETAEDIERLRELHAEMDRAVLKPTAGRTSPRARKLSSLTRPTRTTKPTRAACSGPPTSATKSWPASSPSTPNATPRRSASA